jgi:CheY-like chemotaxis protein
MEKKLENILYVEDDPDIRAIAKIALEDVGHFKVRYFSSGIELLTNCHDSLPDLFLFDVMMPKMDGPTLLNELRKRPELKGIPAIFMTAKMQPEELFEYKKMGVLDVIAKSFDPMSLAKVINQIWNKYYGQ